MNKDVNSKERNDFSYITSFIAFSIAFFIVKALEDNYSVFQDLSYFASVGLFCIVSVPVYYFFGKAVSWVVLYNKDSVK